MSGVELLLLAVPVVVVIPAVWAFKRLWPNTPEPSTSPTTALGGGRQLTTGQIARGVFWGLWLFTLSQVILGAIVMLIAFAVTGSAINSLS